MTYANPPGVAAVSIALIAGAANGTLIPPPGINVGLRIVALNVSINRLATGIVDVTISDGNGNILLRSLGMQLTGTSTVVFTLPEPGFQVLANTPLNISTNSTAAAGTATAVAYYFFDSLA